MFKRKRLKKEYDEGLHSLMMETKAEWEQAKKLSSILMIMIRK